jgi:hypothetical protein
VFSLLAYYASILQPLICVTWVPKRDFGSPCHATGKWSVGPVSQHRPTMPAVYAGMRTKHDLLSEYLHRYGVIGQGSSMA